MNPDKWIIYDVGFMMGIPFFPLPNLSAGLAAAGAMADAAAAAVGAGAAAAAQGLANANNLA